ncbi:hypothetical protein [Streptomyces sp. NPDC056192]|uniref:hypothetical protein n=1 Tax=Streptomyces sp. NPDC056192 TaxID=3345743 RepID=UPI0035D90780
MSTKVIFQTCLVVNIEAHSMQGVLLVRNNADVSITMKSAYVHSAWNADADVTCVDKALAPGQLLACYGRTSTYIGGENIGWGGFTYNGQSDKTPAASLVLP